MHICTYARKSFMYCRNGDEENVYSSFKDKKSSRQLSSVNMLSSRKKINTRYYSNSEKAMATHSSTLAWKIPQMEETGRLQSMGSLRVRHD